jgi:hypothetical protein
MRLNEHDAHRLHGQLVEPEQPEPRPGIETVELPEPAQVQAAAQQWSQPGDDDVQNKVRHVSNKARDEE